MSKNYRTSEIQTLYQQYKDILIDDQMKESQLFFQIESEIGNAHTELLSKCFKYRIEYQVFNNLRNQKGLQIPEQFKFITNQKFLNLQGKSAEISRKILIFYENPTEYVDNIMNFLKENPQKVDNFINQLFPSLYAYFTDERALEYACTLVNSILDVCDFEIGSKFIKSLFDSSFMFHNVLWTHFRHELIVHSHMIMSKDKTKIYNLFFSVLKTVSAIAYYQFTCLNRLVSISPHEAVEFFLKKIIFPSFVNHYRYLSYLVDTDTFQHCFDVLFGENCAGEVDSFAEILAPQRYSQSTPNRLDIGMARCYNITMIARDMYDFLKIIQCEQTTLSFVATSEKDKNLDKSLVNLSIPKQPNIQEIRDFVGSDEEERKFAFLQNEAEKEDVPVINKIAIYIEDNHCRDQSEQFVVFALKKLINISMKRNRQFKQVISMKKVLNQMNDFLSIIDEETDGLNYSFVQSSYGAYYGALTECDPKSFVSNVKSLMSKFSDFPWIKMPIIIVKLNAGFKKDLPSIKNFMETIYDVQAIPIVPGDNEEVPEVMVPHIDYCKKLLELALNSPLGYRILLLNELITNIIDGCNMLRMVNIEAKEKILFKHFFTSENQRILIETILTAKQIYEALKAANISLENTIFKNISDYTVSWAINFFDIREDIVIGMQKVCITPLGS